MYIYIYKILIYKICSNQKVLICSLIISYFSLIYLISLIYIKETEKLNRIPLGWDLYRVVFLLCVFLEEDLFQRIGHCIVRFCLKVFCDKVLDNCLLNTE